MAVAPAHGGGANDKHSSGGAQHSSQRTWLLCSDRPLSEGVPTSAALQLERRHTALHMAPYVPNNEAAQSS